MAVALHVSRTVRTWTSVVMVVQESVIDAVKYAPKWVEFVGNVIFLERLIQVGSKVPASLL